MTWPSLRVAFVTKAFKAGGSTTAGNSSQVTDGAAMVLLARQVSRSGTELNPRSFDGDEVTSGLGSLG